MKTEVRLYLLWRNLKIRIAILYKNSFPYPHKFDVKLTLKEFKDKFDHVCTEKGVILETETTSIAGRVMSIRSMGAGLMFYDIQGDGIKI